MPKFRASISLLLLFVSSSTPLAGSANQRQEEPVRLGVNLVTLDVAVTDKRRRPIHNLTAKDFTVLEDGVPQRIESFSAGSTTKSPGSHKPGADQKEATPLEADRQPPTQGSNRQFRGYRFISIAVDNTSVEAANRDSVERAITHYVRDQLQPDDLVAVYSIANSLS